MFAMICLVHPVAHAGADHGEVPAASRIAPAMREHGEARRRRSRNPLVALPARLRGAASSAIRGGYRDLLALALQQRRGLRGRLPGLRRWLRSLLVPFLGRNFFPAVDAGEIMMHVRAPSAPGSRTPPPCSTTSRRRSARSFRRDELETLVDNIGLPVSGINLTYNNTGVIGPQDGDIQITLKEGHQPTGGLRRRRCASSCRAPFPA